MRNFNAPYVITPARAIARAVEFILVGAVISVGGLSVYHVLSQRPDLHWSISDSECRSGARLTPEKQDQFEVICVDTWKKMKQLIGESQ